MNLKKKTNTRTIHFCGTKIVQLKYYENRKFCLFDLFKKDYRIDFVKTVKIFSIGSLTDFNLHISSTHVGTFIVTSVSF